MDELLEVAILAGGDDEDIEHIVLNNLIPERNVHPNEEFNLNDYTDEEVKLHFRFNRNDLPRLAEILGLPNQIYTHTRNNVNRLTALCIILKRLAYPNRLVDMCHLFKRSPQSLSQIINATLTIIRENNVSLLNDLNNLQWLNRNKLQYYADAIANKGGAVENCWGFIDGTARQICRPSVNQEEYYSGHKRAHCIKYQSVLCPDGIIASLKGAYPGRRHDAGIFRESQLYDELEMKAVINENDKYVLYVDQGYGVMELVLVPFPGAPGNLLPHQQILNQSMKLLRKNQKVLLQDLECMYQVAVLLTNCHTCLYGSQTADYFNTVPPTLETYFNIN